VHWPPRREREGRPTDFRRRFVLGGIGLILFAGVLIGAVSTATVGRQLLADIDQELADVAARIGESVERPGVVGLSGPRSRLDRPGFDIGTLIAVVDGDDATGAFIGENGQLTALPDDDLQEFAGEEWEAGTPQTIHLGGGFREVRTLLVGEVGEAQLVVGLPMTDIRKTIARLSSVIFVIVAASVVLAAGIGMWGLRLALRPLDRIRQTAVTVSQQSLSDPQSRLRERVPDALANPDSEIGQLGAAFNHMLDHVDSSLLARTQSEEKLRQFVSDASHELRTPLASIRGYSEITLRQGDTLSEDVQQSLSRIESESIRMSHLVEDLLMLARLDEGEVPEMTSVDLAEVVRDVLSDAEVRAPGYHWSHSVPSRRVLVNANRNQMVQVVTNLVQNATVHTPEGTDIRVRLATQGDRVVFSVTDSGPGIPEELQPHLFERFRRADKGRSRATGSTGLGLAIVHGIVEAHHGSVEVSSSPGKTVFSVSLPKPQRTTRR